MSLLIRPVRFSPAPPQERLGVTIETPPWDSPNVQPATRSYTSSNATAPGGHPRVGHGAGAGAARVVLVQGVQPQMVAQPAVLDGAEDRLPPRRGPPAARDQRLNAVPGERRLPHRVEQAPVRGDPQRRAHQVAQRPRLPARSTSSAASRAPLTPPGAKHASGSGPAVPRRRRTANRPGRTVRGAPRASRRRRPASCRACFARHDVRACTSRRARLHVTPVCAVGIGRRLPL